MSCWRPSNASSRVTGPLARSARVKHLQLDMAAAAGRRSRCQVGCRCLRRTDRAQRTGHPARRIRRTPAAHRLLLHVARRPPRGEQCEGCTWITTQVTELSYLHSRDITYAVLCQGPYDVSVRYRDFMGWDVPWYSARPPSTRC